jgi:predicted Zn-dependent peptidase
MNLQEINNNVDETFLRGRLSSGLTVFLNPKKGYSKTMGVLGVKFGSADHILPGNGEEPQMLPDGTAHFLEHKLFEDADGDVSDRFAANGATCNASTGFSTTSYLFSCTNRVPDNLRLLLSFVQTPYFTDELVRKEQGIIQQEIKMYDDDPGWIIFFNLMKALYREHPVRQNIAGTVESIARITPDFLERCYRSFYRPGNMVLSVVGGFDPDEIYETAERDAESRPPDPGELNGSTFEESDSTLHSKSARAEMVVYHPRFLMGFKEAAVPNAGLETEKLEIRTQIILDALLGKSSPWYESLYGDELIDDSFSASYSCYGDFGFSLLGGDTKEPERLRDRLLGVFEDTRSRGIERESFDRIRNKYLGNYVKMFNSVESTAYNFVSCFFRGFHPTEIVALIREITLEDLNERLHTHFDPDRLATSVVVPLSDGMTEDG